MANIFRTGRPTNFNLGRQTEQEDPYHRQAPWPPRSKVKVARSRDPSDRCWPHKSRTTRPRNTKIGRTVAHLTGNNAHQVRGQKVSPGRSMLKPKVCHLFVGGWSMHYQLSWPTVKALWSRVIARGSGHTVSARVRTRDGHTTCYL